MQRRTERRSSVNFLLQPIGRKSLHHNEDFPALRDGGSADGTLFDSLSTGLTSCDVVAVLKENISAPSETDRAESGDHTLLRFSRPQTFEFSPGFREFLLGPELHSLELRPDFQKLFLSLEKGPVRPLL